MVKWQSKKLGDLLVVANGLAFVVFINLAASSYFFRLDLTEEKRFSIKPQTRQLLNQLEEPVYLEVFLAGDLNASFTRFQKSIRETLEELRIYSGNKIRFTFTDPASAQGEQAQREFMNTLASRGIQPRNVIDTRDGQRVEKIIFPGALVSYGGMERGVQLLKGNPAAGSEAVINQSIEGVEFEIANAIATLMNETPRRIGFLTGHRELDSLESFSFRRALTEQYSVVDVAASDLDSQHLDALIVAKPRQRFSESDKFEIDQYIMRGGSALFLIDKLEASADSASREDYFAFPYDLNIDDLLFRYGVRVNTDLIQDRVSALTPVVTGNVSGKPQVQMMEWPFYPLVNNYSHHPVVRNLDAVVTRFASTLDTVEAKGIIRTPLMLTSPYARSLSAPVRVSINDIRNERSTESYANRFMIGCLLEGSFESLYKNRFAPEGSSSANIRQRGAPARLAVIADGDLARNAINPRNAAPMELGFDPYSNYTFANEELLMNTVAWMIAADGLLQVRSKEVKLRPLDKQRIKQERIRWQLLNLLAPLVVIAVFGLVWIYIRKRRYADF